MNLIEFLREQTLVPNEKAEKFIALLDTYEENDILYDSVLDQIELTNDEFEELFAELDREDFVDELFIIQCPYCDSMGNTYVDRLDIPEADKCRFCDEEFNHKENYISAHRVYFHYGKKIDILEELSTKITYNQDRIFEISDEINELETKRKSLQGENVKFVVLKNELIHDKNESHSYIKTVGKYHGKKVKYIGTLIYMKKTILKCLKCNETIELFEVNDKIIGVCPNCDCEIEFNQK